MLEDRDVSPDMRTMFPEFDYMNHYGDHPIHPLHDTKFYNFERLICPEEPTLPQPQADLWYGPYFVDEESLMDEADEAPGYESPEWSLQRTDTIRMRKRGYGEAVLGTFQVIDDKR